MLFFAEAPTSHPPRMSCTTFLDDLSSMLGKQKIPAEGGSMKVSDRLRCLLVCGSQENDNTGKHIDVHRSSTSSRPRGSKIQDDTVSLQKRLVDVWFEPVQDVCCNIWVTDDHRRSGPPAACCEV